MSVVTVNVRKLLKRRIQTRPAEKQTSERNGLQDKRNGEESCVRKRDGTPGSQEIEDACPGYVCGLWKRHQERVRIDKRSCASWEKTHPGQGTLSTRSHHKVRVSTLTD